MQYIRGLNIKGIEAKETPCITGNGAPTEATEGDIGLLYMDTESVSKDLYKCVGIEDGKYKWILESPTVVNVKHFGAKGNGENDDKQAIIDAFEYAIDHLPATVYFPKGEYMLYTGGITISIPAGKGGLTVCGDGDNQSIIKYAENWDSGGSWMALRIQPEFPVPVVKVENGGFTYDNAKATVAMRKLDGQPDDWETDFGRYYTIQKFLGADVFKRIDPTAPGNETYTNHSAVYEGSYQYENFMHDITIRDISVFDTDPVEHADPGNEETHGFDIQYCHRARVLNCGVFNVGDEAIDMHACLDSHIEGNNVAGSPGAGTNGGGISVGDGCDNVIIANNTVNGTICGEDRFNFGIAVEALNGTVKNIIVQGNTVVDVKGNGINIGSQSHGAKLENIFVCDNIVTNPSDAEYISDRGGIVVMGAKPISNIHISGNTIKNVGYGIRETGTYIDGLLINDFLIDGCTTRAVSVSTNEIIGAVISNGIIKNADVTAIYCGSKNGKIENVTANGVGKSATPDIHRAIESPTDSNVSAINVTLLNCKNKQAIYGVHTVINAVVEQDETLTSDGKGNKYQSITNATVIKGGKFNRGFGVIYANGIIDGVTIATENLLGQNAISIDKTGVRVINNIIFMKGEESTAYTERAISEAAPTETNPGADYNLIANNLTRKMVGKVGANTVSVNNIKLPIE